METFTPISIADAQGVMNAIAVAQPKSGAYAKARWLRDLLLMAWTFHHPERIAEFFRITWRSDNTGRLFLDEEGAWCYRNVDADAVAMSKSTYRLAQPVAAYIPAYLEHARPVLLRKDGDSLFCMPSNHIHKRHGEIFLFHLGRNVGYAELRDLTMSDAQSMRF